MGRKDRPFGRYAHYSFALIACFALITGAALSLYLRGILHENAARVIATGSNSMVTQAGGVDAIIGDDPAAIGRMAELAKRRMSSGDVVGFRILGPDGTVLFTTFEAKTESVAIEASHREALRGEVAAEVVRVGTPGTPAAAMDDRIFVSYAPLGIDDPRGSRGVIEVYKLYGPIGQSVRSTLFVVFGFVLSGALGAYLFLVGMVRVLGRRIADKEGEIDVVNGRLQQSMRQLEEHSLGTLQALASAVDAKDAYTARHSLSVTDHASAIARHLDMSDEQMELVERVGLLHDIGKIGISESLLLKPKSLTYEEFMTVREHSEIGARIVGSIPFLRDLVPIIRHHHERWDGSGYPDGISGEDIPPISRVLAVADAFDAMTSHRPYRRAMRSIDAMREIEAHSGTQFDPRVVAAFMAAVAGNEIHVSGDQRLRA